MIKCTVGEPRAEVFRVNAAAHALVVRQRLKLGCVVG